MTLSAKKGYLLLIFFLVQVAYALNLLFDAGAFAEIRTVRQGECLRLFNIKGTEDLAIFEDQSVLISATDRHGNDNGGLYWYRKGFPLRNLTVDIPGVFKPHGIDVWQEGNDLYVYAINHSSGGDRLEVFLFDRGESTLKLQPLMSRDVPDNANDISVIDKDHWFISFDHAGNSAWHIALENYLRLPFAYVNLMTPTEETRMIKGLRFANGLYFDRGKDILYVASLLDRQLTTYGYDRQKSQMTLLHTMEGLGGVDNIMPAPDMNALWLASHPKILDLSSSSRDPAKKSPSRVWKVSLDRQGIPLEATVWFEDDGNLYSASSTASSIGEDLLIGSVFDRGILRCKAALTSG